MKYLVYSSTSSLSPHFGVLLDEAEKLFNEGHDVSFAYCDGIIDTCFVNMEANPAICKVCKFQYKHTLNSLARGINIIPMKNRVSEGEFDFEYFSIKDIKKLKYKDVYIGYAVLSSYITLTRNPTPKITDESRIYFDHLLQQTCVLINSIVELIDKVKPDVISIFNGRFFEVRPFYDIAKALNIKIICNEVVGGFGANDPYRKVKFYDSLPHNIKLYEKRINELWEESKLQLEEKKELGKSFYENRRGGISAGDKVYTMFQEAGKLPLNWDSNKKNIVIFNSSEDEFAAVGSDYDSYSLFESQLEGIRYILSSVKNEDYYFYLRVHPNLSSIQYSYHTDLYELENVYDNITVIKATDTISTYSLMDAAEKIIVFGSTTGIEAVYWGKPVILLAGAMYYYLDVCYVPESRENISELIVGELTAKDNFVAIKLGYYMMDREFLSEAPIYYDLNSISYSFFGRTFYLPKYLKLYGSNLLMQIIIIWYSIKSKFLFKNKIKRPDPVFVK